ncbi:MAG: hypothetical protein NVV63_06930 [Opitutus sp.]|nr:hypothetical protein [Opitutus sp.]
MKSAPHPNLQIWMDLSEALAVASEAIAQRAKKQVARYGRRSYHARRPGAETPFWNALGAMLRAELTQRGAKARLARYLEIPKQRLGDYLKNGSRIPDGETTLRLLNWLAHKRAGGDLSI